MTFIGVKPSTWSYQRQGQDNTVLVHAAAYQAALQEQIKFEN